MIIRIGTIDELSGEGIEYLIDRPTRTVVIAKFFNGKLVGEMEAPISSPDERTIPNASI